MVRTYVRLYDDSGVLRGEEEYIVDVLEAIKRLGPLTSGDMIRLEEEEN